MPRRPSSPSEPSAGASDGRTGQGTIAFLYGALGVEEMPGTRLMGLLTDLGVSEGAARSAIARQRRGGGLTARRNGRESHYRLDGSLLGRFRRAREMESPEAARAWDGRFACLLVEVPEEHRAWRDALRREAYAWGYRHLQDGLLAHVHDHSTDVLGALTPPPPGARAVVASVGLEPAEMRRRADEMWRLEERARRYDECAARMRALPPPDGPITGADLARYVAAHQPFLACLASDPNLPPELTPDRAHLDAALAAHAEGSARWLGPLRAAYGLEART